MDRLRSLKGRIGEAFVESILRRAGYKVSRIGRESQVQQMLRTGISEFLPDFLIWKQVDRTGGAASLNRVLTVEVKYRYDIPHFLPRHGGEFLLDVADPQAAVPFFQSIVFLLHRPGVSLIVPYLHDLPGLDIYRSTVEEYEGLVKQVFSLLGSHARSPELPQKPLAKMSQELRPMRITG